MFTEIFGNDPRVRLLDFLSDHVDFDYTISQLEEFADVSRPTLYKLVDQLQGDGMLSFTREIGGSKFYKLNLESPKVISMLRMDFEKINKKLVSGANEEPSAPSKLVARSTRPRRVFTSTAGARPVRVAKYAKRSAAAKKRR